MTKITLISSHSQRLQVLVKDPLVCTNGTSSALETFSDSGLYKLTFTYLLYLLISCLESPNLFTSSLTPSHRVFWGVPCLILSASVVVQYLIQMFHTSKPPQSTLLNYQTNWIRTQQFSKFCTFFSPVTYNTGENSRKKTIYGVTDQ